MTQRRDTGEHAACCRVVAPSTGAGVTLEGLRAELVGLIATGRFTDRSLRLLLALAKNAPRLDTVKSGRLEVDLSRGMMHPYLRESWPRIDFLEDTDA